MCGIAGILHFNSITDSQKRVKAMTNALVHRGPDAEGYYNDQHISLGHRRLSIIDLSSDANQPFYDNDGRYVLLFNGEIYNYLELKSEINDYPYKTSSDTEVLMAAFCKWGIDCLKRLDGMFAFSIWDSKEETLWIVRDRMGVKPLYYYSDPNFLAFSSEKRSLLKSGLIKPEIDEQSLYEYFSYQSTGYPNAIIKGIHQIKAGTYLRIRKNSIESKTYWDITALEAYQYDSTFNIHKNIFDLLFQAVQKRKIADVETGILLSGGIDSSAIVSLMSLGTNKAVNTFTLANENIRYDESSYADIISKRFSTDHKRIFLSPDEMISDIETGLKAMDSPTADGINTFLISNAIRKAGLKVALSGVGGDELFAGYPGFKQFYNLNKFRNSYKYSYAFRNLIAFFSSMSGSRKRVRYARMLALKKPSIDLVYPIIREVISTAQINKLIKTNIRSSNLYNILHDSIGPIESYELLGQYSTAEYLGYSQQTLLKDTDQMSMAVGLEIREPFFDHKLIEYVLTLPDKIKFPHTPKQLLVDSIYPMLPTEITNRPKQGFLLPWDSWIRNELFSLCDKHIHSFSQRAFVNEKAILQLWNRFQKKDPNIRWMEIWQLVVLDNWLQTNLDQL